MHIRLSNGEFMTDDNFHSRVIRLESDSSKKDQDIIELRSKHNRLDNIVTDIHERLHNQNTHNAVMIEKIESIVQAMQGLDNRLNKYGGFSTKNDLDNLEQQLKKDIEECDKDLDVVKTEIKTIQRTIYSATGGISLIVFAITVGVNLIKDIIVG